MLAPPEDFRGELWRHHANLRSFAVSLCRDGERADDLVQATFLKALEKHSLFQPGTNLAAWLFTILRNTYFTEIRRNRTLEDPGDVRALALPCVDDPSIRMEAREVLRLIEIMPPEFAATLRLIADGASYEEVAAEFGEHVGTIKSRTHRARAMLGKP